MEFPHACLIKLSLKVALPLEMEVNSSQIVDSFSPMKKGQETIPLHKISQRVILLHSFIKYLWRD